jgi:hypothetical protein
VTKILVRYDCILAVLSAVQGSSDREEAAQATGLKNQLESFLFIFNLHVIHKVLAVINPLSEQLQAPDMINFRRLQFNHQNKKPTEDNA